MIESVDFWARRQAERCVFAADHAVISITDPQQQPAAISGAGDVLRLEFYDLTEPAADDERFGAETLFSARQAQALHDFVQRMHAQPEARTVIVHCEAGVSRSAAVALFVGAATGCRFTARHKSAYANKFILNVLAETTGVSVEIPKPEVSPGGILLF